MARCAGLLSSSQRDAATPHTRKVALRTAMVMSPDPGGVFDVLLRMTRFGLGGSIGGGHPTVSWIDELGACVLRTDTELRLESRRGVPARLHRPRGAVAPAAPRSPMTLARAAMNLYIAVYSALIVFAAAALALRPGGFVLCERRYWRYLAAPWKLVLFVVAFVGIVAIAPWTGDRTWDHVDAGFMAALAFTTAPWSVGVLYQSARGWRRRRLELAVAIVVWLFSASWSYDLYLLWRDGYYPVTWRSNLGASSLLYLFAGLLWNLQRHPARGVIFGFMDPAWPVPEHAARFGRLAGYVALIALPVALAMVSFVLLELGIL